MCSIEQKCDLLTYDDSRCKDIAKCCVGVHDQGDHAKCTSATRACQNFGTTWEPRRPMKPLNFEYIYNDTPGYATTGAFVLENFGGAGVGDKLGRMLNPKCLIKNLMYALAVTAVLYCFTDRKMNLKEMGIIALVSSLAKCLLL